MYVFNFLKSFFLLSTILWAYLIPGYLQAFGFDRPEDQDSVYVHLMLIYYMYKEVVEVFFDHAISQITKYFETRADRYCIMESKYGQYLNPALEKLFIND
jgi:hypothetical protein